MAKSKKKGKKLPPWLKKEKDLQDEVNDIKADPHEGDRGEAKREGKKNVKEEGCKKGSKRGRGKKDTVTLNLDSADTIKQFIGSLSQKNYAEANKYLQAALEDRMKSRIAETQHKLGF